MYEMSCELIYKMISQRINDRKKSLGVKSKDILDENFSLMSAICNNRRHIKKNPYLIPKACIKPIQEKLGFNSIRELLFGDDSEIEAYSENLFFYLIYETITMNDDDKNKFLKYSDTNEGENIINIIDTALTDYVPYAFFRLYIEEVNNPVTLHVFPPEMLDLINDPAKIVIYAIIRLYMKATYNNPFSFILYRFFNTLTSTVKLDKSFLSFVKNDLIPLIDLNGVEKDVYSLGHKFYNALAGLRNQLDYLFIQDHIRDKVYYFEEEDYYNTVIYEIENITKKYSYELYLLQNRIDIYLPKINSNWNENKYQEKELLLESLSSLILLCTH